MLACARSVTATISNRPTRQPSPWITALIPERFARARALPLIFVALTFAPRRADAQTTGELAAFSALMVTPVGALPPLARDAGTSIPDRWNVSLRYGGWRYDVDDGVHNNVGLTIAHRLGRSRTTIAITGAHLSLDCACSVWASGGVAARSIVWSAGTTANSPPKASFHVANELAAGGAYFTGEGHARAYSLSDVVDVGGGIPFFFGSRVAVSLLPGIGRGSLSSVDVTAASWRPLIGGALSWTVWRGLAVDVGFNRAVIAGGPTQAGGGISWRAP